MHCNAAPEQQSKHSSNCRVASSGGVSMRIQGDPDPTRHASLSLAGLGFCGDTAEEGDGGTTYAADQKEILMLLGYVTCSFPALTWGASFLSADFSSARTGSAWRPRALRHLLVLSTGMEVDYLVRQTLCDLSAGSTGPHMPHVFFLTVLGFLTRGKRRSMQKRSRKLPTSSSPCAIV